MLPSTSGILLDAGRRFKTIAVIDLNSYDHHMVKVVREEKVLALQSAAVSAMSGVPLSTLNHWVAQGLCRPSVLGPAGNRVTRYWHPRDLVVVQSIRALRLSGCSFQTVRKVQHLLEKHW